jgi:hypothetical protein
MRDNLNLSSWSAGVLTRRSHAANAGFLFFAFSTLSLFAHPGHDLRAYGAAHIITSPFHLAFLAASGLLICCVAGLIHHRLGRRLVQISGAAMIGFAGLLWFAGV